jgi:hypothetical protein
MFEATPVPRTSPDVPDPRKGVSPPASVTFRIWFVPPLRTRKAPSGIETTPVGELRPPLTFDMTPALVIRSSVPAVGCTKNKSVVSGLSMTLVAPSSVDPDPESGPISVAYTGSMVAFAAVSVQVHSVAEPVLADPTGHATHHPPALDGLQ